MNYPLIENDTGHVVNVIDWDGVTPYTVPDGYSLAVDPNDPPQVTIGWTYSNGTFSPPSE